MKYPDQITPQEASHIADSAKRYIHNTHYGVLREAHDAAEHHPFVNERSYAALVPHCHVQATGRNTSTQTITVVSQYMDIVSEQIDRYWVPNGQRVVTGTQMMLAHWLTYPVALDELAPPPLVERAARPSDRQAYRAAHSTLAPIRNMRDIPSTGEQIALATIWLDVFQNNTSVHFLRELEDAVQRAGLDAHDARMGKVSPYIVMHMLAVAHDAEQRMQFDPELPVEWQQGRFTQQFFDVFHERRDLLHRLITTVKTAQSKRSVPFMHRLFLR